MSVFWQGSRKMKKIYYWNFICQCLKQFVLPFWITRSSSDPRGNTSFSICSETARRPRRVQTLSTEFRRGPGEIMMTMMMVTMMMMMTMMMVMFISTSINIKWSFSSWYLRLRNMKRFAWRQGRKRGRLLTWPKRGSRWAKIRLFVFVFVYVYLSGTNCQWWCTN